MAKKPFETGETERLIIYSECMVMNDRTAYEKFGKHSDEWQNGLQFFPKHIAMNG